MDERPIIVLTSAQYKIKALREGFGSGYRVVKSKAVSDNSHVMIVNLLRERKKECPACSPEPNKCIQVKDVHHPICLLCGSSLIGELPIDDYFWPDSIFNSVHQDLKQRLENTGRNYFLNRLKNKLLSIGKKRKK